MYDWYCQKNIDYVGGLIDSGQVPIYWNDVDCYYWSPSVVLPSGNVCDFFCYNNRYAPKHHPWDIAYRINPTREQMEELEKAEESMPYAKPVPELSMREQDPLKEASMLPREMHESAEVPGHGT